MEKKCCKSNNCCDKPADEAGEQPMSSCRAKKYESPEKIDFSDDVIVDIIIDPKPAKTCCGGREKQAILSTAARNMAFEGDEALEESDNAMFKDISGSEQDEKAACRTKSSDCCKSSRAKRRDKPAGLGVFEDDAEICCRSGVYSAADDCCSVERKEQDCPASNKSADNSFCIDEGKPTCITATDDCCSNKLIGERKDTNSCCGGGSVKTSPENERNEIKSCCKSSNTAEVVDLSSDDCCFDKLKERKEGQQSCCNNTGNNTGTVEKLDTCLPIEAPSVCCTSESTESCVESKSKATVIDNTIRSKTTAVNEEETVGDSVKSSCCTVEKKNESSCSKSKKSSCAEKDPISKRNSAARKLDSHSSSMPNLLNAMENKVTYGSFKCSDHEDKSGCLFTCQRKVGKYTTVPCDSSDDADDVKVANVITTTKLRIQNICCGKEAELMKRELEPLNGIEAVSVNIVGRIGFVKHNKDVISTERIVSILNNLHLGVSVMESGHHDDNKALNKEYFIRLGMKLGILFVLAVLFIPIIIGRIYDAKWRKWVAIAEVVIGALPIIRKTILNWMKKVFVDINVLMLIAVIGTIALQEWIEGATVVFVFAIAECLQEYCTYRVQKAISGLMVRVPEEAVLAETGKSVPVEEVDIGSIIVVCAGEKIPLDGKVIKGQASVDESSITGESVPIEKSQGDKTFSGTIVQNGFLEIVTTSDSLNSTVSKVTQLVQEAQGKASHTEEIMNKFAKIYTPIVLTTALLIFAIPAILAEAKVGNYSSELRWWGVRALIVLLIACPCALVMSVPMPVVCGITAAARNGVLIKGGTHMENLARIKTVALDKTGTLTEGRFRVINIQEFGIDLKYNEIMKMVAALEIKSSHPVASALVNHYSGCITDKIATFGAGVGLPDVSNYKTMPGLGLSGQVNGYSVSVGNLKIVQEKGVEISYEADAVYKEWSRLGQTVVCVVIDKKLAMMIGLADTPRPTAKIAINLLKTLGIETIMLTGDSSGAAASVMKAVGARSFIASMKPEDKLEWIRERQNASDEKRTRVAMVGDGVNDGPSLAAADVGIAIGACGTALAIESAGVALMSDSLVKIPEILQLSKFTRGVVFQNIALALLIKVAVMVATMVGSLTLWMAVLSDVVALLLVILNGFRPLLWKRKDIKDDSNLRYSVNYIDDVDGDYEGIALIDIKS